MLAADHVIDRPTWFRMYAMWKGETTDVKTGVYSIKDDLAPEQVLQILVAGVKEVTVKVTLPEGKNMLEFFALLDQAKVAKASELEAHSLRDREFLSAHAIAGDSVEGYTCSPGHLRVSRRRGTFSRAVLETADRAAPGDLNELLAKHGPRRRQASRTGLRCRRPRHPDDGQSDRREGGRRSCRAARGSRRCSSTGSCRTTSSRTGSRPIR